MRLTRVLGRIALAIIGVIVLALAAAAIAYPPVYVYRVMAWRESDAFDWQKFPPRPLTPSPVPYRFPAALNPRVGELLGRLSGTDDWDGFLEAQGTQAFIVIHDGSVVYEQYFNDTRRDSIVTSFSVAKSFVSALVGLALQDGYIRNVEDPVTVYLPELAERDSRFRDITIRHLLLMASGLEYREFRPLLLNGDDPLTTYFPDQRKLALENTRIVGPPSMRFQYNKYHPQLLGMILERTTGMPVTTYLQTRLWDPLGMEFEGSWSLDSRASGFEKMEAGLNARAIDFAKFGVLFLNGGLWQGKPVISKAWVEESTAPYFPKDRPAYYPARFSTLPGRAYYRYFWWGMARDGAPPDFAAEGDKGQIIYISPHKRLVIVRNGVRYGVPMTQWVTLFFRFADQW